MAFPNRFKFLIPHVNHSISFFFFAISGIFFFSLVLANKTAFSQPSTEGVIKISKTEDFIVTGTGSSKNWTETEWISLTQRTNRENSQGLQTTVKVLYSDSGIYFLFLCEDEKLSASIDSHFEELWQEDVVEVFLWPDESEPVYFEYELSPLNYELPILVSNNDGVQSHWIPFDYSYKNDRKTQHETSVTDGEKASGSAITEWRGEFYIPFELLRPLKNIFPESGTKWRANMYRIDYDHGPTAWTWQPYENNFHDIYNYGTLLFE